MELGYEARSRKFIERLDRIQNCLQSLPPLPKIRSAAETLKEQSNVLTEVLSSADSQLSDDSADSDGSSSTRGSVSTRSSRAIPKDCDGQLLQQTPSVAASSAKATAGSLQWTASSGSSSLGNPLHSERSEVRRGPASAQPLVKKKKKRRKDKVQDPLRPTERRSFGVDIGQGMNVINYIKQNVVPGLDQRNNRLLNILTRDVSPALTIEASLSRIYKQGPLTADSSGASLQFKTKESEPTKKRRCVMQTESCYQNIQSVSDTEMYRVKFVERAVELPHHHGLDALQELFVPYLERHHYPETETPRNPSDVE